MRDFLPEYRALAIGGRYRPLFRLFEGENWRMVRDGRKPMAFDTASAAISAAKARVKELINPTIRSSSEPADPLGMKEWLATKDTRVEAERKAVFGDHRPATVFPGKGRAVEVEYRRRKA